MKIAVDMALAEAAKAEARWGHFRSSHELAAVLREEFEEFWESVRADAPDAMELIQVAAVAIRGAAQIMNAEVNGTEVFPR